MQESPELRELYLQSCEAQSRGDHAFFERHFSSQKGAVAIGTDPAECWEGYATITRVFKAQLGEAGEFRVVPDRPLAYCEGSVGWVAGRPTLELPDGSAVPVRLTVVFHREQSEGKIVQWHFSTGISNEELTGETLTLN